jgi:hypothetical protein
MPKNHFNLNLNLIKRNGTKTFKKQSFNLIIIIHNKLLFNITN